MLNGRKAVVYPYITVYDGDVWSDESKIGQCSGMTTYKYYVYDDERYQDSTYFEAPRYFGKVLASEEKNISGTSCWKRRNMNSLMANLK